MYFMMILANNMIVNKFKFVCVFIFKYITHWTVRVCILNSLLYKRKIITFIFNMIQLLITYFFTAFSNNF